MVEGRDEVEGGWVAQASFYLIMQQLCFVTIGVKKLRLGSWLLQGL